MERGIATVYGLQFARFTTTFHHNIKWFSEHGTELLVLPRAVRKYRCQDMTLHRFCFGEEAAVRVFGDPKERDSNPNSRRHRHRG